MSNERLTWPPPAAALRRVARQLRKGLRLAGRREYRAGLRHGVAASVEHDRQRFEHDFATVLDVGANHGQFALFAHRRFPDAALICFEPLPQARETLEKVTRGIPRARVVDVALAATSEDRQMHVARADDSSSLLEITDRQVALFPGTDEVATLDVHTKRLDEALTPSAIAAPALLKIDVQGAELEVLEGAEGILPNVAEVLVECSFVELYAGQALADEVVLFLHAHGFRLADVGAVDRDAGGVAVQADLRFRRH